MHLFEMQSFKDLKYEIYRFTIDTSVQLKIIYYLDV